MASTPQIEANRQNSSKSTGPRTADGKSAASRNATRHGMFSRHLVLPGEDQAEFDAFRGQIHARLAPADELERVYVERFVAAAWKLQRLQAAEAHAVQSSREYDVMIDRAPGSAAEYMSNCIARVERFQRYSASLERSMDRALAELRKLQEHRKDENEPNSAALAPMRIVETKPIAQVRRQEGGGNRENEPNPTLADRGEPHPALTPHPV